MGSFTACSLPGLVDVEDFRLVLHLYFVLDGVPLYNRVTFVDRSPNLFYRSSPGKGKVPGLSRGICGLYGGRSPRKVWYKVRTLFL